MAHTGKTKLAGVLGWPVSHSLSPQLHGYWLDQHGIDGAYVPLPVNPENFSDVVSSLRQLGFAGANVTVPHKEAAFDAVDVLSAAAQAIGAVNTLVFQEDGTLHGDNTDAYGFLTNIRQGAPDWDPAHGPAVVLGAGGAARAVVWALADAGVPDVILCNRTRARAEDLAAHFGAKVTVADWEDRNRVLSDAALLVNTTTLGMSGHQPLQLDLSQAPATMVVTDIVYSPLQTALLENAGDHGLTVVDGLGMLLHQAVPGFEAWFGVRPDVTPALRSLILDAREQT